MAEEAEKVDSSLASMSLGIATQAEKDLAHLAGCEFEKGNYDACLSAMSRLAATRGHDPKVMLNRAVADYYRNGLTKTDDFRQAMKEVSSKLSLDDTMTPDDVDHSTLYYNHAVVLYHLRQYRAALGTLEKLVQFIEPLEENLTRKITFLLVELYLCTHQPYKALEMLTCVEKSLPGNGASGTKSASQSPEKEEAERTSKETKEANAAAEEATWRAYISQFKARCFLMLKSAKSCKREVKTLVTSTGMTPAAIFIKCHFEFLRGNHQKALRVLGSLPQATTTSRHTPTSTDCLLTTCFYNDLAILHLHLRKHHLGASYLSRALEENRASIKELDKGDTTEPSKRGTSGRPLPVAAVSRHFELAYNTGVQLLHCGQPLAAFDCLMEAVQAYHVNPRLWLRLAECCIMAHTASNDEDRRLSTRMEVVQGAVGSGVHRKLVLGGGVKHPKASGGESAAIPVASLEFAAMCLDNALLLLSELSTTTLAVSPTDEQTSLEQKASSDTVLLMAPPGNPMRPREVANLRCSVLASRAYVALCLSDHQVALQYAEELQRQPRLSGAHRYLSQMYMTEALVALDRIADGIQQLSLDQITDVSTIPPEVKTDAEKSEKSTDRESVEPTEHKGSLYAWTPRDIPQAKGIMLYNLATAHAIRGEHEKALQQLGKSTLTVGQPLPAQMYYLKIYLELMQGHKKGALNLIRDHFGHIASSRT